MRIKNETVQKESSTYSQIHIVPDQWSQNELLCVRFRRKRFFVLFDTKHITDINRCIQRC